LGAPPLPAAPFCQTKRRAAFADNDVVENPLPYFPFFFPLLVCHREIINSTAAKNTQQLKKNEKERDQAVCATLNNINSAVITKI